MYPLIILGAGASHDYVDPSQREGDFLPPPVTDHLLRRGYLDRDISIKYPDVEDLFSVLAPIVNIDDPRRNRSLEECLVSIRNKEQLIALAFYLKDYFNKISNKYHRINNYKALKDKIINGKFRRALVISFNYDTLFEKSISEDIWNRVDDYIKGEIKIIKPHGSCNWSYIWKRDIQEERLYGTMSDFDYFKNFQDLKLQYIHHDIQIQQRETAQRHRIFPALAVPTTEVKSIYCPESHIELLKKELKNIDRLLIVGWKAGDSYILKILRENIGRNLPVVVVSPSRETTKSKLNGYLNIQISAESNGFSEFIKSKECATFFGLDFP